MSGSAVSDTILRAVLQEVLEIAGNQRLPVNPFAIADQIGARTSATVLRGAQGLTVQGQDHIMIWLDESQFIGTEPSMRGRFTLAHELGHVFITRAMKRLPREVELPRDALERIADVAASHLLIPRKRLAAELRRNQPSWVQGDWVEAESLVLLRRAFKVSLHAMARAVQDVSDRSLFIAFRRRSRRGSRTVKARVDWSTPVDRTGRTLFPDQTSSAAGAAGDAIENGQRIRMNASLSLRPLPVATYGISGAPLSARSRERYLVSVQLPANGRGT